MSEAKFRLISAVGTGSALVEAMLAYKALPFEITPIDYEAMVNGGTGVAQLNPLCELPVLILPNGKTMTESAAIALYLDEQYPDAPLLGLPVASPHRSEYLRRLIFMVAAVYPTFTYGDEPKDWIQTESVVEELKKSTDAHRNELWLQMEREAGSGPYWFGGEFTAIDIYLSVMSHWRPRQAWFKIHAPKLWRIIESASAYPSLKGVWSRNFNS